MRFKTCLYTKVIIEIVYILVSLRQILEFGEHKLVANVMFGSICFTSLHFFPVREKTHAHKKNTRNAI